MSVKIYFLTICNDDFHQKIRTFWVFEGGGKKMVLGVWIDGFCPKTVTLHDLNHIVWVK